MRRRADDDLSAEPTQLRYFVDTNVLGIIATRTHPLRIGYPSLIAAEEFDDRTPSISTIVADEVEAGLSTLDAGGPTAQQLAAAMRAVLNAFDHMDLDDEGQTLADELQQRARAAGHPLGAPSQRNDLIIASLAIRHHAPLISHNYRDFINIDALDLRTLAPIRKRPPRVRLEPDD
jgi:predicted nucleic acid-binding protein